MSKEDTKKLKKENKKKQKERKFLSKQFKKLDKLGVKIKKQQQPRHLDKISIPDYTLAEELINSISHGIGALLAIAGLVLCLIKATTVIGVVSVAVYGALMIILYVISCIYHALSPKLISKKVMRIIDHINVLLMVAGTYTPICLSLVGGALGWIMFAVTWIITIVAVVLNAINVDKYSTFSVICNLVLGWASMIVINPLMQVCPLDGIIAFLIGGGVVYSIGAILYGIGAKKRYMHSIFHFFVIAASILHFFFIYLYCI